MMLALIHGTIAHDVNVFAEARMEMELLKNLNEPNRRHVERLHDRHDDSFSKMNEAAISSGQLAARTLIIINGGAAISLLAFMGGLLANGKISLGADLNEVARSLIWFAYGVSFGTMSMGAAFFANYSLGRRLRYQTLTWEPPYVASTKRSERWALMAVSMQIMSAGTATISLALYPLRYL